MDRRAPSTAYALRDKRRRDSTASLDERPSQASTAEDSLPPKRKRLNDASTSAAGSSRADRFREFEEGSSRAGPVSSPFDDEYELPIDVDALTDTASPPPQSTRDTDASFISQVSYAETERQYPTRPSSPAPVSPKADAPSSYNCPICFSPPTYATLTPCGHVCCGDCLFSAVKSSIERAAYHGAAAQAAKCPVCRAPIPGWDGKGGGVIGLKPRVLSTLGSKSNT